ncbi:hypothetical protein ACFXKH_07090 [Streptomyces caelestis]|uniref:hypothetical protein n=1 Tax=Streptomyces caelestis TaxID=36816 RepID=UPI00369400CF
MSGGRSLGGKGRTRPAHRHRLSGRGPRLPHAAVRAGHGAAAIPVRFEERAGGVPRTALRARGSRRPCRSGPVRDAGGRAGGGYSFAAADAWATPRRRI